MGAMNDPRDQAPDFSDLRRRAEERLQAQQARGADLSPDDALRFIHELQVHQIELEIQNEELRESQNRLEESLHRYSDLYDFAPVGYLTLDRRGRIDEANLTAATLLGWDRGRLLGQYFPLFMPHQDERDFQKLLHDMTERREQRGEFHLKKRNGDLCYVILDVLLYPDARGKERYRISLTDVTELKYAQEKLHSHQEDLEDLVAARTAELLEVNEKLREANENLQALFVAAPLALGVFDAKGKVLSINPAAERIFGWTQEELKGRWPFYKSPEEARGG
jgi:PAS domain S-box-containing protein